MRGRSGDLQSAHSQWIVRYSSTFSVCTDVWSLYDKPSMMNFFGMLTMKTFSLSLSVLLSSSLAWADEPSPSKDVETTQTEAAGHSESAPTGATPTPQSNGESTQGWTPPTSKQQAPADDSPWSRPFTGESDSPVSKAGRPLTPEELLILDKGLYSSGEIYGGAAMGFVIGYGTGHMIQGRYGERGWIATVGTLGGITVIISAVGKTCTEIDAYGDAEQTWCGGTRLLTGLLVIVGTKVWEVADLLSTPKAHNKRYRSLKERTFMGILPTTDGEHHGLALTMTF